MKALCIFLLLVSFFLASCSKATRQSGSASLAPQQVQLVSLPEDPCAILTVAEVSAASGVEVTSANRVPSLDKIVKAQNENRQPDPGTICSYETRSDFKAIMIYVPPRPEQDASEYWKSRAKYFESYPGSAQPVPGLGVDAWISGGASLHVLARGNEWFTVTTQMYQPRSREILVNIAVLW